MSRVSLYIPCYNVERYLAPVIEGVLAQNHAPDEILVINDCSRDGTLEVAKRYPQVRIVEHEVNRGLAAGRNTAFKAARNELVAALDADCVPDPDWLARLVELIERDSQLAIVGGQLLESHARELADRWRCSHLKQAWGPRPLRNPPFMFGNNSIMRRSVVEQVGWFDEALRTNGEDADLCRRVRAAGFETFYEPSAVVHHLRQDTVRSILDTYYRYWLFGSRAYVNGFEWLPFLRHTASHAALGAIELGRDLGRGNFSLLWVDALLPAYMIWRDIQLLRKRAQQTNGATA